MKRRDFIALVGSASVAWPLSARAQQQSIPTIGLLSGRTAESDAPFLAAFQQGLRDGGLVEGRTAHFEYRWADNQPDRVAALVAELIARQPAVIAAIGGAETAIVAKRATSAIPIVFVNGADAVKAGLVELLNRPGGNVTGVSFQATTIVAKRLDLLRAIAPKAARIAILVNPNNPDAGSMATDVAAYQRANALQLQVQAARNEGEIDTAFATIVNGHADALLIGGDTFFNAMRYKLIALSTASRLPAMFDVREFATEGGLMSYGASQTDAYRQAADYVARILKGEKPGDLPVQQPTRFELVINLKAAKTLGLDVPPTLIALADEVIE